MLKEEVRELKMKYVEASEARNLTSAAAAVSRREAEYLQAASSLGNTKVVNLRADYARQGRSILQLRTELVAKDHEISMLKDQLRG